MKVKKTKWPPFSAEKGLSLLLDDLEMHGWDHD